MAAVATLSNMEGLIEKICVARDEGKIAFRFTSLTLSLSLRGRHLFVGASPGACAALEETPGVFIAFVINASP